MSLILEALRKSEAERRRGDAPDLCVELPPPAPPQRRTAPFAWIAGGALLAALALVVLWPRDGTQVAADGDRTAATPAIPADPPAAAAPSPGDAAGADVPASGRGVAGGAGRVPPEGGFPVVERIQAPDAGPAPKPVPDHPSVPEPRAAADLPHVQAPEPTPGVQLAPPPMATRTGGQAPAATIGSDAPAAGTRAGGSRGALRVNGLSSSQRERLPGLKLSLHMWNEDPARRFAVIDGQRRIEGDRLGDATITAIDRDGVLLDLDGQAVRVPLP